MRFAQQLGVEGIQMNTPKLPGDTKWEEGDLRALVERCQSFGLVLEAIENVPVHFYDKVMLGQPGRDEQMENYCATIRAVGAAGISGARLPFHAQLGVRTERMAPGRGGAGCTQFDMAIVEARQGREAMLEFLPTALGTISRRCRSTRGRTSSAPSRCGQLRLVPEARAAGGRGGWGEAGAASG
jgi:mannonate dehydratase